MQRTNPENNYSYWGYLSSFFGQTTAVTDVAPETNEKRLSDIGFNGTIPREYICQISCEIMDNPIRLDGRYLIDYKNLEKYWASKDKHNYNPYTVQPFTSLEHLPELKQRIVTFVEHREKEFQDAIILIKAQKETEKLEKRRKTEKRKNKLIDCRNLRDELVEVIGEITAKRNLDINDENDLKKLIKRIDKLNLKIKLLKYPENLRTLRHCIIALIEKQLESGLTENEERKLAKLLDKLDTNNQRPHSVTFSFSSIGLPDLSDSNQKLSKQPPSVSLPEI